MSDRPRMPAQYDADIARQHNEDLESAEDIRRALLEASQPDTLSLLADRAYADSLARTGDELQARADAMDARERAEDSRELVAALLAPHGRAVLLDALALASGLARAHEPPTEFGPADYDSLADLLAGTP